MDMTGIVVAVCRSEKKGVAKINVSRGMLIEDFGLENDAHAGKWHKQVSLLSHEAVELFKARGADVEHGAFGENLLISGVELRTLPVGTRLCCENAELEITQIGKECHSHCAIYEQVGDCIMPREGVFARVIKGGEIGIGDTVYVKS